MFNLFKKKKFSLERSTTMGALLNYDMGTADILIQHGMHCVGCPSHANETLEEACMVHGIDCTELMNSLQKYLDNK